MFVQRDALPYLRRTFGGRRGRHILPERSEIELADDGARDT